MDGQGLLYTKLSHIQDRAMLKVLQASQLGLHDVEDKFGIEEERATDFSQNGNLFHLIWTSMNERCWAKRKQTLRIWLSILQAMKKS